MTDEKIIKALECCSEISGKGTCQECFLHGTDGSCTTRLTLFTLDLIKELKKKNESLDTLVLSYGDYVTKARAEAIKEFAERLKPMYMVLCVDEDDWHYEINTLVKEMVGEEQCTNQK